MNSVERGRRRLRGVGVTWFATLWSLRRRHRRVSFLLLILFAAVLLATGINWHLQRTFPTFDGPGQYSAASVWELLKRDDDVVSLPAGTNAIPFLIEYLQHKPSRVSKGLDSIRTNHRSVADWL